MTGYARQSNEVKSTISHAERIENLRATFASGRTRCLEYRTEILKQLYTFMKQNRKIIVQNLDDDYKKRGIEIFLYEIQLFLKELKRNLDDAYNWENPKQTSAKPLMFFETPYIHSPPYGVCLILDAWNSPVSLAISAAIGAVAAGNAVVLLTKHSLVVTSFVRRLFSLLDPDTYLLVDQGTLDPTAMLRMKFDHIYFTGSGPVGQHVFAAAEETATPVTLEQNGRSVAVIDVSADLENLVRRIHEEGINGRKPDHILCPGIIYDRFVEIVTTKYADSYGVPFIDLGRPQYKNRLKSLLRNVCTAVRVSFEPDGVLGNDDESMMREQSCGMRPLLRVKDMTEAAEYINSRDKPLTTFLFARDIEVIKQFMNDTATIAVSRIVVWD